MEDRKFLGSGNFENNLQDGNFTYEKHPVLTQQFKDLMGTDQATFADLQKIFDTPFIWSMHDDYKVNNAYGAYAGKVNNACGMACIAVLEGDHKRARQLFEDAAEQGSFWAMHSFGIYQLCDLNIPMASSYFQRAYEKDSWKIAKDMGLSDLDPIRSHRQIIAMLGLPLPSFILPQKKKLNFLTILDEKIIQSSGKKFGDLAYPLAVCAEDVGDIDVQKLCLDEAIKMRNQFSLAAFAKRNSLYAKIHQQVLLPAVSESPITLSAIAGTPAFKAMAKEDGRSLRPLDPVTVIEEQKRPSDTQTLSTPPLILSAISESTPYSTTNSLNSPALAAADSPMPSIEENEIVIPASKKKIILGEVRQSLKDLTEIESYKLKEANRMVLTEWKREKGATKRLALLQELTTINNERLKRTINFNQRNALLNEMLEYGDSYAECEEGKRLFDKGDHKKGWDLLKSAITNDNNPDAHYALILRGLKAESSIYKLQAADSLDQLLHMKEIQLNDEQKGAVCAAGGAYAWSKRDKRKAYALLQEADTYGNHEHAYIHGTLSFEQGLYEEAKKQFALAAGAKAAQARLYSAALEMINDDSRALSTLIESLMAESESPGQETTLKEILSNADLHTALMKNQKNPHALMILAHCEGKGWGKIDKKPDSGLACKYYTQALAIPMLDESLKRECIRCLRALGKKGCKESLEYVRKHYPDQEDEKVMLLYGSIGTSDIKEFLKQLADVKIDLLEKDATGNETKKASNAQYCLAVYYNEQGEKCYNEENKAEKKRSFDKALHYLESAAKSGCIVSAKLIPAVLYNLATATMSEGAQYDLIKRAADDAQYPNAVACLSLYYYHDRKEESRQAEEYLKKAFDLKDVEASFIYLQREHAQFERTPEKKEAIHAKINALLELLEKDTDCLNDKHKDNDKARLYELKAEYCNDTVEKFNWYCKAVQFAHSSWALRVAMYDIQNGNYKEAEKAIKNALSIDPYKEHTNLLKAFLDYKLSNNDAKKRIAALEMYALSLSTSLEQQRDEHTQRLYESIARALDLPAQGGTEDEERAQMVWAYLQKDYQKAYDIGFKLSEKSDCAAYNVMVNFYLNGHGVCEKDDDRALALVLCALVDDKSLKYHYSNREKFAQILRKNKMQLKAEEDIISALTDIYQAIESDQRPNNETDIFLLDNLQDYLADFAVQKTDTAQLLKWYNAMSPSHPAKLFYKGWLHFYKMLDKKDSGAAAGAGVSAWLENAKSGNAHTQKSLLMLFDTGKAFSSGVVVQRNLGAAADHATKLFENPDACAQDKAYALSFFAREALHTYLILSDCRKKIVYIDCLRNAEEALKLGSYDAFGYQIVLHIKDGNKDAARALYALHADKKELWQNNRGALPLVLAIFEHDFCSTKHIVEQLTQIYAADTVFGGHSIDVQDSSMMLEGLMVARCADARKDPVAHGFKDQNEVDSMWDPLEKKMKKYNENMINKNQKGFRVLKFLANNDEESVSMAQVLDTIHSGDYVKARATLEGTLSQNDPYRDHSLLAKAFIAYKQSPDVKKRSDVLQWYNYSLRKVIDKPQDAKITAFHQKIFDDLKMPEMNETEEELEIKFLRAKIEKNNDEIGLYAADLVGRASKKENVVNALKWYKEIPECYLHNPDLCMFQAWFDARNAFQKSPEQARNDYIASLETAAKQGQPRAQEELVKAYAYGVAFPSASKIEPDSIKALSIAHQLINNKEASELQKQIGYKIMIREEESLMSNATKASEKCEHFNNARVYYTHLIKVGFYSELPNFVKLGFAMKDIQCEDSAESVGFRHVHQIYQHSWNNDALWKNNMISMPFCAEIVHVNPGYLKQLIFEKLVPNFNKTQIFSFKTCELEACIEALKYLKQCLSLNIAPEIYGFENKEQKEKAMMDLGRLMERMPTTLKDSQTIVAEVSSDDIPEVIMKRIIKNTKKVAVKLGAGGNATVEKLILESAKKTAEIIKNAANEKK